MRFLWIAPQAFYSSRGTPMNVRRLAEAIAGAGHAIDLVTYALGSDVPLPPTVRVFRARRLPFLSRVPIGPSLTKIALDVGILLLAARLLRDGVERYGALQGFEEGAWIAGALSRRFRVPFIYDMDSDIEAQLGERLLFRPLLPVARWIDRTTVHASLAVLTVCRTLSERVGALAPGKPVFQIEDAPNVDGFAERGEARRALVGRWRLPSGPLVVYTGNLEPYQGVDLLVRAVPRILVERPDAAIVIVGGGARQVEALRSLARKHRVGEAVKLLGERPEAEMADFLAAADVLVSPRSLGTNTPLKLYAYLMSGTPVIATDRPVHTQILSPNEAILVPPTAAGIADGVLRVLREPAEAATIAANAARLVAARYSPAAFADKARAFAAAIETLVASRASDHAA
jgi:glycosyltransferase involved in cell wall biosynthesis